MRERRESFGTMPQLLSFLHSKLSVNRLVMPLLSKSIDKCLIAFTRDDAIFQHNPTAFLNAVEQQMNLDQFMSGLPRAKETRLMP
jgi:hypothetical protein